MSLNATKYLQPPEIESLVLLLARQPKDSRDALLIRLAIATGARASELLEVTAANLNRHERTVLIRGLKGSNDREIPLTHDLYADLEAYSRTTTGRLFPFSYRRLQQIWSLYRTTPKKFHALRHTFAIRLYAKTKDLRLVKYSLGHKSINNTMIYAEYAYTANELRQALL
jgi:integrase